MSTVLQHTPLHAEHVALGGKLVPFAGYEMPVQYPTGINAEHQAVRNAAGLFDVSHMGEFDVRGAGARDFVQYVTSNDVDRLEVGQAQYSTLLRDDGTVLDDLIVYRRADGYMLVVNASNRNRDLEWVRRFADRFGDVHLTDRSDDIALLALRGPRSEAILSRLAGPVEDIGYYRFREGTVDGRPALVSRTGYTGEDGFELYVAAADAVALWRRLLEVGEPEGLIPAGLGARDSLRLEMGYALYGNDIEDGNNPLEAGLGWVVRLNKGDFVGRDALVAIRERGLERRLVGFRLTERGFPRRGYPIAIQGEQVGSVTSGVLSPTLGAGIGMGYVPPAAAEPGTAIEILIRDRAIPAEVVKPPFHTGGTVKR